MAIHGIRRRQKIAIQRRGASSVLDGFLVGRGSRTVRDGFPGTGTSEGRFRVLGPTHPPSRAHSLAAMGPGKRWAAARQPFGVGHCRLGNSDRFWVPFEEDREPRPTVSGYYRRLLHQQHGASALDLSGNFSVQIGRHAGYPARQNLAAFRHEFAKQIRVLVIDRL